MLVLCREGWLGSTLGYQEASVHVDEMVENVSDLLAGWVHGLGTWCRDHGVFSFLPGMYNTTWMHGLESLACMLPCWMWGLAVVPFSRTQSGSTVGSIGFHLIFLVIHVFVLALSLLSTQLE